MNANTEIKRDRNAEIRKHMFRNCNNFYSLTVLATLLCTWLTALKRDMSKENEYSYKMRMDHIIIWSIFFRFSIIYSEARARTFLFC